MCIRDRAKTGKILGFEFIIIGSLNKPKRSLENLSNFSNSNADLLPAKFLISFKFFSKQEYKSSELPSLHQCLAIISSLINFNFSSTYARTVLKEAVFSSEEKSLTLNKSLLILSSTLQSLPAYLAEKTPGSPFSASISRPESSAKQSIENLFEMTSCPKRVRQEIQSLRNYFVKYYLCLVHFLTCINVILYLLQKQNILHQYLNFRYC